MCKRDFELHFCTCDPSGPQKNITHNKNSRRNRKNFDLDSYKEKSMVWTLQKYKGEEDSGMLGSIVMPRSKFTDDLTEDYFIESLNSKNLFDFDYAPEEGDYLTINVKYRNKDIKGKFRAPLFEYMCFIFREGKWTSDFYDPFVDVVEDYKKGKVEIRENLNLLDNT